MQTISASGGETPDPYNELRKLLTIDEVWDIVNGLFLIQQKNKYGDIRIRIEPGRLLIYTQFENLHRRAK